jgi:predicted GH43/DUF377 family glycosyl hydrolase
MKERSLMRDLFQRVAENPILVPSDAWWEAGGVLNPGVAVVAGRVMMLYRASGIDHISRFGVAWSDDGVTFGERQFFAEAALDDPAARLGIEDPRLVMLDDTLWASYTKVAVQRVGSPMLTWEPAPFQVRMALAQVAPNRGLLDERLMFAALQGKDGVLFPQRIGNRYYALIREYPALQITSSADLRAWSPPQPLLAPLPGTWEAERVGAGPPPILTPFGWLLIYHGNESYQPEGNKRHYRAGLAILDRNNPTIVRYRHPDPIFAPETAYESAGPVGMVVFPTGLIPWQNRYNLYYGAADGVIGLATTPIEQLHQFIEAALKA